MAKGLASESTDKEKAAEEATEKAAWAGVHVCYQTVPGCVQPKLGT
jgi:hypothetical protein